MNSQTTTRTTADGCVEIVVMKKGLTEIGWVSSQHLVHSKEQQLLMAIDRKLEALGDGSSETLPAYVIPPIHDA